MSIEIVEAVPLPDDYRSRCEEWEIPLITYQLLKNGVEVSYRSQGLELSQLHSQGLQNVATNPQDIVQISSVENIKLLVNFTYLDGIGTHRRVVDDLYNQLEQLLGDNKVKYIDRIILKVNSRPICQLIACTSQLCKQADEIVVEYYAD